MLLTYIKCIRFSYLSKNSKLSSTFSPLNAPVLGHRSRVQGWVKALRKHKKCIFMDVSDGTSDRYVQVVIPENLALPNLSYGAAVIVNGFWTESPKNTLEVIADKIDTTGQCDVNSGYPFLPRKNYSNDYLRQFLHLRHRTNKFSKLLRFRSFSQFCVHEWFAENNFIHIATPVLTTNDCEGAGELFSVSSNNIYNNHKVAICDETNEMLNGEGESFFGNKIFLSVSGQFHLEAAAHGISHVYSFGPVFRAENSKSRLHLSEFYMIEAEIAFVNDLQPLFSTVSDLLKSVTKKANKFFESQDNRIGMKEAKWLDEDFHILTYDEASALIGHPLQNKADELMVVKKCGDIPVFVTAWPSELKPFYMRRCKHNDCLVDAFDLLVPRVGELVGGGLRENDYEKLSERLPKHSNLEWYLEIRKFGGTSTGGFGIGFERYLQFVRNIDNIKDTLPFPRWPHNCFM